MLATRDQENLAHARQLTAAGKPLNQGIRALQPKTPGNFKTPFRSTRNDENHPFTIKGQARDAKGEASKVDKNAFMTPAGPQNRAPLGAKTANTKAQPLKTPGPAPRTDKRERTAKRPSTAKRSARKITVAKSEPETQVVAENNIEHDEPDFGYAPPRVADLPDYPMEFGYDQSFPQFKPENMTKGYGEIFFGTPTDENGFSLRLKREEEERELFRQQRELDFTKRVTESQPSGTDPDAEVEAMIAAGPKLKQKQTRKQQPTESKVDTVKARSAAALLAPSTLPAAATRQTLSSLQKQIKSSAGPASNSIFTSSSRPLHLSSKAPPSVSKNTIGFPKAKKAPSIIPHNERTRTEHTRSSPAPSKISQSEIHPAEFVELYGEPPIDSDMWFRWKQHERDEQELQSVFEETDDLADEFSDIDFFSSKLVGGDGDDDFQLPMPEE